LGKVQGILPHLPGAAAGIGNIGKRLQPLQIE
jgi:hypothetical protein